jgi:hypothetical protein
VFCNPLPAGHAVVALGTVACNSQETLAVAKSRGSCFWSADQPADLALVPELQQCLHGKKVYIAGTSVSRNWYYQMLQLLSANHTNPWVRSPGVTQLPCCTKNSMWRGRGVVQGLVQGAWCGIHLYSHYRIFRWQNQNIERLTPPGGVSAASIPSNLFGETNLFAETGETFLPAGLLLPRCCTFLATIWYSTYWGAAVLLPQPFPALRGPDT